MGTHRGFLTAIVAAVICDVVDAVGLGVGHDGFFLAGRAGLSVFLRWNGSACLRVGARTGELRRSRRKKKSEAQPEGELAMADEEACLPGLEVV
jgi:arginine exporter protein ArgO